MSYFLEACLLERPEIGGVFGDYTGREDAPETCSLAEGGVVPPKHLMARSGYPVEDELAPRGSTLATSNVSSLTSEGDVEAWWTGAAPHQSSPCKNSYQKTSCPPQRVSYWNRILWDARLELRHTVSKGVSLVSLAQSFPPRTNAQIHGATKLVQKLLTTHRCLSTLDIDTENFRGFEARLGDALRENRLVRFLKINFNTFGQHTEICSAIATLANLKELDCLTDCECPVEFCAGLAKLLRTSTMLTALRIPQLHMCTVSALLFLPALAINSTLEELSFHSSAISEAQLEHRALFVKFLAHVKTLKTLSVNAYHEARQLSLKWLLNGLLRNTALTEVTLNNFVMDAESTLLMPEVLARNHALRVLNIPVFACDPWMSSARGSTASSRRDFSAWLSALAKNKTLEAVTLPLEMWDLEQWNVLFESLAARAVPLKLTVKGRVSESYLSGTLWSAIEEQVSFDTTVYIMDDSETMECKRFHKFHSVVSQYNQEQISPIFRRLSSFAHVTTHHLEIMMPDVNEALCSAIGHYIATTSALKELHLTLSLPPLSRETPNVNWLWESLRLNTSVNKLYVFAKRMTVPAAKLLADVLKSGQNIRRVHVKIEEPKAADAFVHHLRDGIECNHNLLSVAVDGCVLRRPRVDEDAFAICDVTRRNSDVVARAAECLNGGQVDRYGAIALEQIIEYPPLRQEVAPLLSVSEAKVEALVRTKLKGTRSLDEFMRAAGVVRDRVSCERPEDDHVQLDDLSEDCWGLVRRYLKVEDVKDPELTDDL